MVSCVFIGSCFLISSIIRNKTKRELEAIAEAPAAIVCLRDHVFDGKCGIHGSTNCLQKMFSEDQIHYRHCECQEISNDPKNEHKCSCKLPSSQCGDY
ncbi:hypothetical protein AALP_AA3G185200 [Arabis alpina]|uniref:Uncharacterized protein n=1 Tax=Arabis alpina TaxID=50452 RepID=A0A087HA34_ARAAL|nr:hypothetical protein AALP_AA3G185200 [Arabis alpina]